MKYFLLILSLIFLAEASMATHKNNVYLFSFKKIDGENLKLSQFKGSVMLIVNTASECGFTKQYGGLETLYKKYKDRGFVIIAVPSNDFGEQEPGTDDQIHKFCKLNFGITFPIVKKEHVKGPNSNPFYAFAKKELGFGTAPKWNFHKYLIDRQGRLVDYFNSTTSPDSWRLVRGIEMLLEEKN